MTYLMHYGIKGMKWGVRKDRYEVRRANKKLTKFGKQKLKDAQRYQKSINKILRSSPNFTPKQARKLNSLDAKQKKSIIGSITAAHAVAVGERYFRESSTKNIRLKEFREQNNTPEYKEQARIICAQLASETLESLRR